MTLIAKDMAFQPQLECLIFFRNRARSVLHTREGEISRMSFTAISRNQMKKKDYSYAGLMLQVEVRVPVLLKVKSYTRVRFGKTEKVSTYYRRIGVRK